MMTKQPENYRVYTMLCCERSGCHAPHRSIFAAFDPETGEKIEYCPTCGGCDYTNKGDRSGPENWRAYRKLPRCLRAKLVMARIGV
jgi:hypothetical protein